MNLRDQYNNAKYRLQGNGPRDTHLLKEPFQSIPESQLADTYGNGKLIEQFERKFAGILGKEAAVFMPSGVMAQQIALRINADEKYCKNIAYHPLSHLELHEQDAIKTVHDLNPIILGNHDRLFTLEDLMAVNKDIGTLLIELPQREMGGYLPAFEDLKVIVDYARNRGIRLHLDGARLFESLPFYQKTASEVCENFDSVYISFYKGIGAIAGAILAGDKAFIDQAKIWKRRLGGDLISLYPYIIPADFYYEKRIDKMHEFYLNAKELAEFFNEIPYIETKPEIPVTNMFHVYAQKSSDEFQAIITEVYAKFGISITNLMGKVNEKTSKFEVSIGEEYATIPKDLIKQVFSVLKK